MAEQTVQANEEEEHSSGSRPGVLKRYGKYFLLAVILLVQSAAAYWVVTSYYNDIHGWFDEITSNQKLHYSYEDIIINPAQSNGERYLILTVVVEVDNNDDLKLLETENARIVDSINQILSSKTAEELIRFEQRSDLKQEVGRMINRALNKKAVRNLFFTKYVLQ